MTGMGRAVYLYLKGLWWESGGANGRENDRTGRVESQQVVEGGGIYECECGWDHYCVLSGCLLFLSLCSSSFHRYTTTPSGINTPHVPSQSFFIHLPMKMESIEGSETSAIRTKTPGNYPKENILHIEHGVSLKSRIEYFFPICFLYLEGVMDIPS